MNKYLASTLFTGLFVTAAIFSPAQGQEQSLQPQGAWALTKVDRSAQGGNSYCTLSRKYDQDIVLSLGRNQTEEYSLAIDFQKQTFEKDKSLKINLQPGPGQIRAYDMMPTSDKAVVIRLGWDTGFFDSLNKSQEMKVKIADKSYAFAMPEIQKGQGDLQYCMEGLKAASKGGEPAQQTKDVLAAEASGSKEFNAGKSDEKIAVAAAEKSVLQNFADSIKAQEPKLNDEGAVKRKNFGGNRDEIVSKKPEPKEEIKVAKSEAPRPPVDDEVKAEAQPELIKRPAPSKPAVPAEKVATAAPVIPAPELAKIAPAAENDDSDAEISALQKRLDQMAAENAALKQKVPANDAAAAETQKQLAAMAADKKAMEDKIKALEEKQAKLAKPEDVAKTEARAKELEIKNAQLEENLRNAQVRIGEAAVNTEAAGLRKIAELEIKLEAAKTDNATLAKQLESMKMQQEDGRLTAVAGDWDLEKATKRFNEAEREISRLGKQLEQERMSCNREKAEIEQMLFDPAVADQQQIQRLSALEKELDNANAKLKDSQKQIQAAVDQQLAAKTQELASKAQAAETEKATIAQQVATLQQSLTQKDQELAALRAIPKADPAATAKQVEAEVAKVRAEAETQMAALKQSLVSKDQELAAVKAQPKADPAATAKQIEAEIAKVRAASDAQIATMSQTLAAKEQELVAARAQPKADPAATAKQIETEVAKVRAASDAQIASLQQALAAKDQELVIARAQPKVDPAATAQQIAAEIAKARAPLDAEIATLKQAAAAKDQQIATIQATPRTDPAIMKQLADMQVAMADLRKNNDALREQNTLIRAEADKLNQQIVENASKGGARADQVASMQLQVDDLKQQIVRKDTQNLTYQNQIAVLQQEMSQLKTQISSNANARSAETGQVSELTRQIQSLQKQIGDMERRNASVDRSASAQPYASMQPAAGSNYAAPAAQTVPNATYDAGGIKSLLQKAGVSVSGVSATSGMPGAQNFGWMDSSNVKGTASVKQSSGSFDDQVAQYIAHQKSVCGGGDFASMPSPTNAGGAKRTAMYETACVNGGQSMSSSLIFFEDGGRFVAISNQIDAADMDIAMDSRDKIASYVRGL